MDSLDAQLVYQWSYSRERPDFRLPVDELKGIDADIIFFAGLEPWAADFPRVARGVGPQTPILGAFSDTPEMRQRAAQGYDALHILAKAIRSTGSCNPLDQACAIRYMNAWAGANGRYKFDSRGELEDKTIFINVFRNSTPVTIQDSRQPVVPLSQ